METMNLKKNTWSYYSKFMAVSVALLLCTIMVFAQQKDVKGTVLDTNGETVIGASFYFNLMFTTKINQSTQNCV